MTLLKNFQRYIVKWIKQQCTSYQRALTLITEKLRCSNKRVLSITFHIFPSDVTISTRFRNPLLLEQEEFQFQRLRGVSKHGQMLDQKYVRLYQQ